MGLAAILRTVHRGAGTIDFELEVGTLATAAVRLALYEAAEQSILEGGQSAEIDGEKVTRANLKEIQAVIKELTAAVASGRYPGVFDRVPPSRSLPVRLRSSAAYE